MTDALVDALTVAGLAAVACSIAAGWFISNFDKSSPFKKLLRNKPFPQQEVLRESFKFQKKFVRDLATLNVTIYSVGFSREVGGFSIPISPDINICFYLVMTLALWALLSVTPHITSTIFQ